MGPALAAAIPAALGGIAGFLGGERQNQQARKEAARNRAFQERMRNTQWQAAVSDMTAAGINPAVAYSKGPAAAPSGSVAPQEDAIGKGVTSGLGVKMAKAQLGLIAQQANAASAQAQKTQSENINQQMVNKLWGTWASPGSWRPTNPGPLWLKAEAEAANASALARLNSLSIPSQKNLANIAGSSAGQNLAWIKYLLNIRRKN